MPGLLAGSEISVPDRVKIWILPDPCLHLLPLHGEQVLERGEQNGIVGQRLLHYLLHGERKLTAQEEDSAARRSLRKAGLANSECQAEAEPILVNGVQFSNSVSGVGSTSCSPAIHTYKVGNRKTLITSAPTRPPTMTMAKGRCESAADAMRSGRRQKPEGGHGAWSS